LGAVCALVIGFYAGSANSGWWELAGSGPQDSYYNLLVQGFRDGHLSVKREVPPNLGDPAKLKWEENYGLDDLSYYKGKLYLYFGVTPAVLLFWPYAAVTGHYLPHKDAVVFFLSAGFLAGAGLLWAVWRRYFKESGIVAVAAGMLAFGLANFAPAVLGRCEAYEVAISCGYALTMLAVAGIWLALHDGRRRWLWLAAASLACGLAVGARPSLLLGAVILLAPVFQAWREKRRVWPLLVAACGPMALIVAGLMIYNALRFDNPLEFGQRYQLPFTVHQQFSLRYLWFNFVVGFLEPARWSGHFPFVHEVVPPARPRGYWQVDNAFGILTNIPMVWVALAAPLAWRSRPVQAISMLRWFLGAVALLFGMCALPLVLHDSVCLRYEMEYAAPLLLLAVVGALALERALAGRPVWRRAARCGWGLLLVFSVAFNLFASVEAKAINHAYFGLALVQKGRINEAIVQFQKVLQLDPDFEMAQNNLGNALLQSGRTDEAITHFQKVLQLHPDLALAHFNLGNALLQKGRVDEAIPQYRKAAEIKPNYLEAHFNLSLALAQQGRVDEAIPEYKKVLQLNPNSWETRRNLGLALQQKGRADEAIPQYQHALQLKPDDPATENYLAWLLATAPEASLRNGAKAVELARQANLLTGGENPVILRTLAAACAEAGRFSEAVETAQHALRMAEAQSNIVLAGALQSELLLYQAGSPLHGPAQPPH
jgi:tetratricopeptide (TPR) repeat protein